jgi:hypothetical protein
MAKRLSAQDQWAHLERHLRTLAHGQREILMATAELKAALAKIDAATDNIAADIKRLKDKVGTGMSDADVASVQAEADRIASKLEGIAADPDNPDPVA